MATMGTMSVQPARKETWQRMLLYNPSRIRRCLTSSGLESKHKARAGDVGFCCSRSKADPLLCERRLSRWLELGLALAKGHRGCCAYGQRLCLSFAEGHQ